MSQKIRRRGSHVFHKRNSSITKILLTVVAMAAIVSTGYFGMKYISELKLAASSSSETVNSTASTTATVSETSSTVESSTPVSTDNDHLRAFYIPSAMLTNQAQLDTLLDKAAAAKFNAVVFNLKDENGVLYYVSNTELAATTHTWNDTALSLEALTTLAKHIRDKGLTPIPRLYAFLDKTAPIRLASAKITVEGYPSYTWLDNSKENGGKPWLNPYSSDAHRYIAELAGELKTAGFTTLMLDGVQFPNQTSQASYGTSSLSSLSKSEVLKTFITTVKSAIGNGELIVSTPGLAAFGDGTTPFGGNPLTFGSSVVSPVLMPATLGSTLRSATETLADPVGKPYEAVKLAASQVNLRLQLMDTADRPRIMPWLQAYDYSSEQISEQIRAITESYGDDTSYILYHAQGTYDFSALK